MRWTSKQERLLTSMWNEGKPLRSIITATNHSKSAVMTRRKSLGLAPRRRAEVYKARLRIQMDQDLADKIRYVAREFNTNMSTYIRRVLVENVEKWEKPR